VNKNVAGDRDVSDAILSVGRVLVKDFHSVCHAFTLNKTLAALPSVLRTTTLMHITAQVQAMRADANVAVLAVWRALDLHPVTASPVWNIRSTTTLLMELLMHGYAAAMISYFLQIMSLYLLMIVFAYDCDAAVCFNEYLYFAVTPATSHTKLK